MWYFSSGDQFVSRCLEMLPFLWMELGSPPPPPPPPAWNDDWGKAYSVQQFPMFDDVPQFFHLKLMCLASMMKHCQFFVECFNANHAVWQVGNYSETIPNVLLLLTHGPPMEDHSWGFLPMLLSSKNSTL